MFKINGKPPEGDDMKKHSIAVSETWLGPVVRVIENSLRVEKLPLKTEGRDAHGLIYFFTGSVTYHFPEESLQTFTAGAGDVLYLPEGSVYAMDVHAPSHYLFVDFRTVDGVARFPEVYHPSENLGFDRDFRKLLTKWNLSDEPSVKSECHMLLWKILSKIQKNAAARYLPKSRKASLDGAVEYILDNIETPITVTRLAAECGLSEGHFRRLFKEIYRVSPVRYILGVRLKKACGLLQYSNQSVSEIALSCGFSGLYYFSRAFHDEYGMTPTEYRRKNAP